MIKKSKQQTEYTCGPAILEYLIKEGLKKKVKELDIAKKAKSNKEFGTFTRGMIDAAKFFGLDVEEKEKITRNEFFELNNKYFMVLLLSTGPNYGHWFLSLPIIQKDENIFLDDPWNSNFLKMTWEQLEDCWKWSFDGIKVETRKALVIKNVSESIQSFESIKDNLRSWELPFLKEFPENFIWNDEAILYYKKNKKWPSS